MHWSSDMQFVFDREDSSRRSSSNDALTGLSIEKMGSIRFDCHSNNVPNRKRMIGGHTGSHCNFSDPNIDIGKRPDRFEKFDDAACAAARSRIELQMLRTNPDNHVAGRPRSNRCRLVPWQRYLDVTSRNSGYAILQRDRAIDEIHPRTADESGHEAIGRLAIGFTWCCIL